MGYRLTPEQVAETYGGEYDDIRAEQQAQAAAIAGAAKALPPPQSDKAQAGQNKKAGATANDPEADGASNVDFAAPDVSEFPDQAAIDNALNTITHADQQALIAPVMQPIIDLINGSTDALEALGKLAEVYPQMNDAKLEALLARMMFVALLHGKLSAQSELA